MDEIRNFRMLSTFYSLMGVSETELQGYSERMG
mgnify:CR=1 FL=1